MSSLNSGATLSFALNLSIRPLISFPERRAGFLEAITSRICFCPLETTSAIPSAVAGLPKNKSSTSCGPTLSILKSSFLPVTIAILALRAASKRGRIMRLRPTPPASILPNC